MPEGLIIRNINRSKLQQKEAELEMVRNRQDIRFMLTGYYLDLFQPNNQKRVYENNIAQTSPARQGYAGILPSGYSSEE